MDWFTDPNRPYIQLFGLNHILYVLIVAVAITLLLTRRRWGRTNRALVYWSILAISLTQFSLMQIWYLSQPTFNLGDGPPLHISRITTLLGLAWLLTRKRELMDLASFLGIFAYFTFLLPQRIYPITHLMGWSFLVSHALIIILPLCAWIAYGWRPSRRSYRIALGGFVVYLLVAIGANALFDGNYFYLKHRPVFAGNPSPRYELGTILFAATIFHLGWLVAARFNDVDRATKLERSGAPARDKPDLVRV